MKEIVINSTLKIVADEYGHGFPIGTEVIVCDIFTDYTGRKSYMANAGIRNRVILAEEFELVK